MATPWTVTIDCADPGAVAAFWATTLGYELSPPPEGFDSWDAWSAHHGVPEDEWNDGAFLIDPSGQAPALSFLKVPEGKVAKNRLHLDVQAGGGRKSVSWEVRWPRVTAEVDRLVLAGARVIAEIPGGDGRPDHVMMADPEGNEFCVL